jgi:hypothetical protein
MVWRTGIGIGREIIECQQNTGKQGIEPYDPLAVFGIQLSGYAGLRPVYNPDMLQCL